MRHPAAPERLAVPGWVVPVVYALATLVLFRAFAFSHEMLFGADTEGLGYMARAFYAESLKNGDFPLWNPILLGGTPFLESLAGGDSLYPPSALLLLLLEPFRAIGWKLVLHVWLAGLFMYGWTRVLGCSRAASFIAGLGYLVAPFFVSLVWPAHDGKMFVTALTPLLFMAVESWFARGRLTALAGVGAVVALTILTTHFQMAYFLFGATGAYALFRTIHDHRSRSGGDRDDGDGRGGRRLASPWARFAAFVAISVVGAGAAGVQLLPALDYIGDASRRSQTTTQATPEENRAYAASWGMHPEEAVASLAVPEFVGASTYSGAWTDGTYWGRNAFKYNSEYIGLALLLLALLSFFGGRRRPLRLFLAGLGALSFLYTLNTWTPVWGLFYAVVPGLELFRAPSMAIFLTGFAIATLAALGVDRALEFTETRVPLESRTAQRVLWGAVGLLVVGLLLAGSGALLDLWRSVFYGEMDPAKAQALQVATPFITRGFLFAAAVAAVVAGIVEAARRGWLQPSGVVVLLAALVAVDGGRISDRFVVTRPFDEFAARSPVVDFLLERKAAEPPFRVLDLGGSQLLGGDVRMGMWGLELAGGHHPNDLRRYRELVGMRGGGRPRNLFVSPNVDRLLNVRYVVWPAAQVGAMAEAGLTGFEGAEVVSGSRLRNGDPYEIVYRLPALDRARLVGRAEIVDDEGEGAVARILEPDFDPATTVVLARSDAAVEAVEALQAAGPESAEPEGGGPRGTIEWLARGPDRVELRVTSDRPALLVMAENYYPTWHATVDGTDAPVLRAYHTLQAVPIGAGSHEVVLEVRTDGPVRTGMMLSAGSWLLLAGLAGLSRLRRAGSRYTDGAIGADGDT